MSSLTGATAKITLSQATLFPNGFNLSGFAADDVTDIDPVKILEHLMGVDSNLSFGFVWAERMQKITLQADSASNAFFDVINTQQESISDVYPLNGTIQLKAIGMAFTCINGGLETYKPMSRVQKILKPREYVIVWNRVIPVPVT